MCVCTLINALEGKETVFEVKAEEFVAYSLAARDPEVAAGARRQPLQLLDEVEDALPGVVAGVELGAGDDVAGEPRHVRAHLHLVAGARHRLTQRARRLPGALRHVPHPATEPVGHERRRHHVALVRPRRAVGHDQAAADEVLGALPLQPRLAGDVRVPRRQQLPHHARVRHAHPGLAPVPVHEQPPCTGASKTPTSGQLLRAPAPAVRQCVVS